jgi:lariat debranching enzyme
MKIAIEGCCHGELDNIYEAILNEEKEKDIKIDLLICCGDFESIRNNKDLNSMSVPDKYKDAKNFHEYYSGKKKAPLPTLFIGGNLNNNKK